jgi:hypothetical protein
MRRRGIKRIEVAVAGAIVAGLVFLAITLALKSREAARRAQCVNNLKQIGLALLNYESAWGVLPPTSGGGVGVGGDDFSMKARLMPFIEASAWYYGLNHAALSTDPRNWTCKCTVVSVFLCPSDANEPCGIEPSPSGVGPARQVGSTSYPNTIGTLYRTNGGKFDGPAYVLGAPGFGPPLTLGMITDGTANTAIFGEWIRGRGGANSSRGEQGPFRVYTSPTAVPAEDVPSTDGGLENQLASACRGSSALDPILGDTKGQVWMRGNCGEGGGYSHIMPPNDRACLFRGQAPDPFATLIGASSYHPGGVHLGLLDGSVRFVRDRIDPANWRAVSTYDRASNFTGPTSY